MATAGDQATNPSSSTTAPNLERRLYVIAPTDDLMRTTGTTGQLRAGFWRTHANAMNHGVPMCKPDGSCPVGLGHQTPSHESSLIVEGSAVVTVVATGQTLKIGPGTIISHPKNIENLWDIAAPYLKKFFVGWVPSGGTEGGAIIAGHVSDNPDQWTVTRWSEPNAGEQSYGEAYFIRRETDPHTMLTGVWRGGVGIAGGQPKSGSIACSAVHGDTTIYIVEGRFTVRNDETGEVHEVKAGDGVGLSEGLPTTWTPRTPFVKTYFVVTRDAPFTGE